MSLMKEAKTRELYQAQAHLYRHIFSILTPLSLKCAVQLRIPDIIYNHGQPITLPHLLSALKVPPTKANCLQRLMSLLAHNGFFTITQNKEEEIESYALTPASEILVSNSDICLSPMVRGVLDPGLMSAYDHLADWFGGDERTLTETAFGVKIWEFLNQNLESAKDVNEAMASDAKITSLALRDCKAVFEGLGSVVDVGGGTGTVGRIICEEFPHLHCTVFDRPQVVENLVGTKNLSFVGGDMFESIPHADAVLLKSVLHNWGDDDCVKILKKCKDAISSKGKEGKLIIIEEARNEKQDEAVMAELKLLFDISLLTLHGGIGRTEKEWKHLFLTAGYNHYNILPICGYRSVIQVYP